MTESRGWRVRICYCGCGQVSCDHCNVGTFFINWKERRLDKGYNLTRRVK